VGADEVSPVFFRSSIEIRIFQAMREIGRIKQVQVQRSPLKAGQKPNRVYDPAPLLVVSKLLLSRKGTIGFTAEGEQIIDVHHVDHPDSRNVDEINGISIGFSSHYQAMRGRFGGHLVDGCAGENILVETDDEQSLAGLERGVVIQVAATGQMINLHGLMVAAPCVEFSRFAARTMEPISNEQLKATLQFLDDGRRGFYATLAEPDEQIAIQAGDSVFALD
jgi:hypothetical protein